MRFPLLQSMARSFIIGLLHGVLVRALSRLFGLTRMLLLVSLATICASAPVLAQTPCYKWTVSRATGQFADQTAACQAAFNAYVQVNYGNPGQTPPNNYGPDCRS